MSPKPASPDPWSFRVDGDADGAEVKSALVVNDLALFLVSIGEPLSSIQLKHVRMTLATTYLAGVVDGLLPDAAKQLT